jgi:hypothetical protein
MVCAQEFISLNNYNCLNKSDTITSCNVENRGRLDTTQNLPEGSGFIYKPEDHLFGRAD